jgi:hypothetical protein
MVLVFHGGERMLQSSGEKEKNSLACLAATMLSQGERMR